MIRIVLVTGLVMVLLSGCKKKPKETAPDTTPPPVSAGSDTSPQAGGGALINSMRAARRTNGLNELSNLGTLIEEMRDPYGKMPTKDQIVANLKKSAPTILKAIEDGSYILTGTTDGSGLWAYEVDADKQPGIALIAGRAQRTAPEEIKKYLGTN
jgi:hypothetical protein